MDKSHNRTERDSQGVGRDILISKKLFLELCEPRGNSWLLRWSILAGTQKHNVYKHIFELNKIRKKSKEQMNPTKETEDGDKERLPFARKFR